MSKEDQPAATHVEDTWYFIALRMGAELNESRCQQRPVKLSFRKRSRIGKK